MRSEINTDLESIVAVIRENTNVPCAIGFGISTPKQAAKMAEHGTDAPEYVGKYVKDMKDALK